MVRENESSRGGEFTNIDYSSCNLGSINLVHCVNPDGTFNFEKFEHLVREATRFLNNVIDVNNYPIEKIKTITKSIRPIGLGIMGFAHMFYKMGIPYNSKEALHFADELSYKLTTISMDESIEIAKETGSYGAFDLDTYIKANTRLLKDNESLTNKIKKFGIANSSATSIAPTGTLSFVADTTGGIEPQFALVYSRKIEKNNKEYEVVYVSDEIFDEYLSTNFDYETKTKILKEVGENNGSCQKVKEIPQDMKNVFVVASDLTPMEHLEMLAVLAKNTSLSISKTINMPSTATKEEVSEVYLKAYELGVIGVTVFRSGSRDGILIHKSDDKSGMIVKTDAPKRPKSLPCHVYKFNILNRETDKSEKWIVFVGLLNDEPYEIIAGKIDSVDIPNAITEGEMIKVRKPSGNIYQFAVDGKVLVENVSEAFVNDLQRYATRLMSWGLRHGGGINYLRDVLQKSNGTIVDFDKAIIRAINRYVKEVKVKEKCPQCGNELRWTEGCIKCSDPECSYTKCGG